MKYNTITMRALVSFVPFHIKPGMSKRIFSAQKKKIKSCVAMETVNISLCFAGLIAKIGFWSYVLSLCPLIQTLCYCCYCT